MPWPIAMPSRLPAASPTKRRAPSIAAGSRAPLARKAKARCSRRCRPSRRMPFSAPGEGDLFQTLAANARERACDRTSAAAPIKIAGAGIAEERPHDQAIEPAHIERVTTTLEQVFAKAQTLIERIEIELVDLALVAPALARVPEGRIARDRATNVQHQGTVAGLHGIAPPLGRALANHAVEVTLRDDAAVREQPRLPENVGERLRIGRLAAAHPHLCT